MKQFVCGFYFNQSKSEVLLIKKNRPDWMKSYLNGVGGHIEPNETIFQAMVREFKEETDISTIESQWYLFTTMLVKTKMEDGLGYDIVGKVFCFRLISDKVLVPEAKFKQMTDEQLVVMPLTYKSRVKLVPSVSVLLEMAIDEKFINGDIVYLQDTKCES